MVYDSAAGNVFQVIKLDGKTQVFKESMQGLYYQNTGDKHEGMVLITTIVDKKSSYSQHDYSHAVLACKVHNMIGQPSLRDYLQIVDKSLLPNCLVMHADIKAAEDIFGPNLEESKASGGESV